MRPGSPLRFQPLPPSETPHAAPTTPSPRPTGVHGRRRAPRWPWGNQPASIPKPPVVALFRVVVDGRDAPVQAGPQLLRSDLPPATVRHAHRRSGERHERSIPRPPALPAPLADPPIAPQPTHTRLRRACTLRTRRHGWNLEHPLRSRWEETADERSLCSDEPFTFAVFRVHDPRIRRSTSPECAPRIDGVGTSSASYRQ